MDALEIVSFIKSKWIGIEPEFIWDKNNNLTFIINTGKIPQNRRLVKKLKQTPFWKYWCETRINKNNDSFTFEINPKKEGYYLVSEYAKKFKTSRQNIHVYKEKYKWFSISKNHNLIKKIST